MLWGFLALLCIIVGFATAAFNHPIWVPPWQWWVAALAFAHLNVEVPHVGSSKPAGNA